MTNCLLMLSLVVLPGFAQGQSADTIYHGGEIVTVNDAQPTAEAVAVKDGRILAVGSKADVLNPLLTSAPADCSPGCSCRLSHTLARLIVRQLESEQP